MSEATPEQVTLSIDGQDVTVPAGTNVIEAAKQIDIDISAFCYHPGLEVVAVCRQCLIKVEGAPKLQPACQQICSDGMVVHTTDHESSDARRQMLEFTLLNHPIDCPICDKAGECTLQKLYFEHDNQPSRVDVEKVHKPKVVDLGPNIVLDAERCILCTRCIRVCDEVAGQHQLEMANRGDHEELGTAPGESLDNPYSLNTVDVCPVGALTAKDFRFTMRAWELMTTPSICQGCSTGCNIEVHHRNERTWRLVPRHHPDVNSYWMCDAGRVTYHALRQDRMVSPTVDGLPANWERALSVASEKLRDVRSFSKTALGVVFSPQHSNEDNYALAKLCKEIWQLESVYMGGKPDAPELADDILRDADQNPNRKGVQAIAGDGIADATKLADDLKAGTLRGLIILGHQLDLDEEAFARAKELEALVVIADTEERIAKAAHVALPSAAWTEGHGTVTNRQGYVQRMHAAYRAPGQAIPAWEALVRLAKASAATMNYDNAKQLFSEMSGKVPAFGEASWGRETLPIQLRFANSRG